MARAAEEAGFDSIWVGDHLIYREGPERGPWEAWTSMAALAAATERVTSRAARRLPRLATFVSCRQDGRHDRRGLRRPVRARRRRRLERARVPRLRAPLRPPCFALRRGLRDRPSACWPVSARRSTERYWQADDAVAAAAAAAPGSADGRLQQPADALSSRCRGPTRGTRGGRTTATRPRASPSSTRASRRRPPTRAAIPAADPPQRLRAGRGRPVRARTTTPPPRPADPRPT